MTCCHRPHLFAAWATGYMMQWLLMLEHYVAGAEKGFCYSRFMTENMQYTEQGPLESLTDSDGDECSRLDEREGSQYTFIWSPKFEKWHECLINFNAPMLTITEFEDEKMEVIEKQLLHLKQKWYHGSISRREAKIILQDFRGGNGSFLVRSSESYAGKFAISFVHDGHVKHIVIESSVDPVSGVLYHITPNGPQFSSLYELIEEAQRTPVIQNHSFEIVLKKCPPKPDMRWLHRGVKSLSQAEQLFKRDHRDGAFFVYRTKSKHSPYIVAFRSNGNILHNLIVVSQRPHAGYTLNGHTVSVLYKLVHYFMENPIYGTTVLKHPIEDKDPITTSSAVAVRDHYIPRTENNEKYLGFSTGSLITNITCSNVEGMWLGDHRGDKRLLFPASHVRQLTKEENNFIKDLKSTHLYCLKEAQASPKTPNVHTYSLDLKTDYKMLFDVLTDIHEQPTTVLIEPLVKNIQSFKLSFPSSEDLEHWYPVLQMSGCLPRSIEELGQISRHRRGCVIC